MASLHGLVPKDKLRVFDLGSEESLGFNPLEAGTPLEAAQRLFSSLTWSEEYYKSKAFSALQKLFQNHHEAHDRNPTLLELSHYLDDPETFIAATIAENYPKKLAEKDFMELSGLRDQIKTLCMGYLGKILSPEKGAGLRLEDAASGCVLYFRLQSLMSPQLVATVGRLLINQLNFLAGSAHRSEGAAKGAKLIPTYLDEFASFACPEFADLISKTRSAGLALHFSHQSIGDLTEVSQGFLNRITDNSGTKIVMRINDPDSAEYCARTYGTKMYRKTTQRITNAKEVDRAEVLEEGTQRDAHQFRASPDLFKTLPTGVGSVLIAHGDDTPNG
ncbi:MAG: TraM recognition domain-containing protein, partial [Deltaproteobacteria bacterium]|nr:TraM recognition domain-containing protein [Deltaproteobacteria bacterium]